MIYHVSYSKNAKSCNKSVQSYATKKGEKEVPKSYKTHPPPLPSSPLTPKSQTKPFPKKKKTRSQKNSSPLERKEGEKEKKPSPAANAMVETRRSSASKRSSPSRSSSSAPPPKRPKVRAPRGSKNLASPPPDLTPGLTDLNCNPNQAEAPASPTASAPGRTEEDSAAAAAARSTGSAEDAAAKRGEGFRAFWLLGFGGMALESIS